MWPLIFNIQVHNSTVAPSLLFLAHLEDDGCQVAIRLCTPRVGFCSGVLQAPQFPHGKHPLCYVTPHHLHHSTSSPPLLTQSPSQRALQFMHFSFVHFSGQSHQIRQQQWHRTPVLFCVCRRGAREPHITSIAIT